MGPRTPSLDVQDKSEGPGLGPSSQGDGITYPRVYECKAMDKESSVCSVSEPSCSFSFNSGL